LSDEIGHLWTWFRGPTSLHLAHIVLTDRQFPQDKYSIKLVDMATGVWMWNQIFSMENIIFLCDASTRRHFCLKIIPTRFPMSFTDATFWPTSIKHEPLVAAEIFGEIQPCRVTEVRIVGLRWSNIGTSLVANAVQLEGNVGHILAHFNET